MAKFIRAAAKDVVKGTKVCANPDPVLFKNRPALEEYMMELVDAGGASRDPSILMVTITEYGYRLGLKDGDPAGWLWREADTFTKALEAIEKALVDGATFSIPGGAKGLKKK